MFIRVFLFFCKLFFLAIERIELGLQCAIQFSIGKGIPYPRDDPEKEEQTYNHKNPFHNF